jgi:hypothetical protein
LKSPNFQQEDHMGFDSHLRRPELGDPLLLLDILGEADFDAENMDQYLFFSKSKMPTDGYPVAYRQFTCDCSA